MKSFANLGLASIWLTIGASQFGQLTPGSSFEDKLTATLMALVCMGFAVYRIEKLIESRFEEPKKEEPKV